MFGDYGAFIVPSYVVTFGAIGILAIVIFVNHRTAKAQLAKLEAQGVRRRADAEKLREQSSSKGETSP